MLHSKLTQKTRQKILTIAIFSAILGLHFPILMKKPWKGSSGKKSANIVLSFGLKKEALKSESEKTSENNEMNSDSSFKTNSPVVEKPSEIMPSSRMETGSSKETEYKNSRGSSAVSQYDSETTGATSNLFDIDGDPVLSSVSETKEKILAKIQKSKIYPRSARERKIAGDVELLIFVRSDGSLEKIQQISSGTNQILNDAAFESVKNAFRKNFPPVESDFYMKVTLSYKLK